MLGMSKEAHQVRWHFAALSYVYPLGKALSWTDSRTADCGHDSSRQVWNEEASYAYIRTP